MLQSDNLHQQQPDEAGARQRAAALPEHGAAGLEQVPCPTSPTPVFNTGTPVNTGSRPATKDHHPNRYNHAETLPTHLHSPPALLHVPVLPHLLPREPAQVEADNTTQIVEISNLDPEAAEFISQPTSQANCKGGRKNQGKGKKSTLPTDATSIELEYYKVEISTLQALLQKQETEIKDLRFRNTILMERNKTLEEEKTKSIHEKYFPTNPTGKLPAASTYTAPGPDTQQIPAAHPACRHHYCLPAYHCPGHSSTDQTASSDLEEIVRKVNGLSNKICRMEALLDRLSTVQSDKTPTASLTPPTPAPPIPAVGPTTPVTLSLSDGQALDSSVVSMEGFVFNNDDVDINLN